MREHGCSHAVEQEQVTLLQRITHLENIHMMAKKKIPAM